MSNANNKRVCPNCGRKMRQQFIGLNHCKCGTSWKKDIGYFERTPGMVFALQRQTVGKKVKQVPVIRYNSDENSENDDIESVETGGQLKALFSPISINNFLKINMENNPTGNMKAYKTALQNAVNAKKSGAVCSQCGNPIWAIGSATVGWNGCFACITGESDSTEDYEIEGVCF